MYKEIALRLPDLNFEMPIIDQIMELEQLRYKILQGSTHPLVFHQVKNLFHVLESIGSSRIEGNNTTILDYMESAKLNIPSEIGFSENIREISNIERATQYIEDTIEDHPINLQYLRELHILAVESLSVEKEGCLHPGCFRRGNVRIQGSNHIPPDYTQVDSMMQELVEFVNRKTASKYDLLKICIAHHRFVWIHPFENGNGRAVRLFTYAMLLKNVFNSKQRIVNPTAVFCSDRAAYYDYLAQADTGTNDGLIAWSEYVLTGLKHEIEKVDHLVDYPYLVSQILLPAIDHARANEYITDAEVRILKLTIASESQELQAGYLKQAFGDKTSSEISRMIKKLIDKGMLLPIRESARKYVICFSNNYLMRSMLVVLGEKGFLPMQP